MSFSQLDKNSDFNAPMGFQDWLNVLRSQEAELAFGRARNRSRLRRWLAALKERAESNGARRQRELSARRVPLDTADKTDSAIKAANWPISALTKAIDQRGNLRPLPALRRAHLTLWLRLWLAGEAGEPTPVSVEERDGALVLADIGPALVALEFARYREAKDVAVVMKGGIKTPGTVLPYERCLENAMTEEYPDSLYTAANFVEDLL